MQPYQNIKKFREDKNLKQSYVAKQLGITQQAYSSIERGRTKLTRKMAEKIAGILGKTVEDIYSADETEKLINGLQEKVQKLYEELIKAQQKIIELEEELRKRK